MSGRILPWIALAAVAAVALYYLYGQPAEVTITAPSETPPAP